MMKKSIKIFLITVICVLLIGCGENKPTADDLLDKFLAGEIDADRNGLYGEGTFNISDLQMDVKDWASYSIGKRLDLDNDGKNEQILNGPYGGIYLDASDGKVKVFACGQGTAVNLSYTYSEGEYWIVYSDTMHVGRKYYNLEKYFGADNLVESASLQMEYEDYDESKPLTYSFNDNDITEAEYEELYQKYFGSRDKTNNGYPRGEQIAGQTFVLNFEAIAEVTFASYLPDDSENPLADVVFLIEKDGEVLSQLPGVSEDNVNTEMFYQVEAVNFSDYNYDGCDDIILIISYYFGAGPQAATPHSTIRYYTGSETGEFTYEKEMSQNATTALAEITIKTAKEFIGYNGPKQETTPVGDEVAKSLYEAFLKNEISVANPYVEGNMLSVIEDEDYEFTNAKKEYVLLDVNGNGAEELIFRMTEDYSNIMYILGVSGEELVAFDVYETHSKSVAHGVYTNGIVWWGKNYDGEEEVFYTYNYDGAKRELIHFVKENEMTDEENTYDYYYINGNAEEKVYLQSYDEYESAVSAYKGEWLEWNDLSSFTGL